MTDPQPKPRLSHKVEYWDSDDRRWTEENSGSEEGCRQSYEEFRQNMPSIPVRLVLVTQTTVEMFDPPAPWNVEG